MHDEQLAKNSNICYIILFSVKKYTSCFAHVATQQLMTAWRISRECK